MVLPLVCVWCGCCVEFLIEKYKVIKKKKKKKTRTENNAKHEMGWVEKMNTEFKKQKMSSESEITPMITKQGLRFLQCYKSFSNRMDPHL